MPDELGEPDEEALGVPPDEALDCDDAPSAVSVCVGGGGPPEEFDDGSAGSPGVGTGAAGGGVITLGGTARTTGSTVTAEGASAMATPLTRKGPLPGTGAA